MFGDIARGYAFGRVAASTRRTYEANWRSFVGKGCWLQKGMGEWSLWQELAEFMGALLRGKNGKMRRQ